MRLTACQIGFLSGLTFSPSKEQITEALKKEQYKVLTFTHG